MESITLSYGSGGRLTHEMISAVFQKAFKNAFLDQMDDAAVFGLKKDKYAYTTDSYVVDPLFFPGGNIGKMAVCGTVNDLASCGAQPLYLSAGFILEEGLSFETLEKVVEAMALEARRLGVRIVCGDTKVVPRGKADKIFINTSGLGQVCHHVGIPRIRPGDRILVTGRIGEHGLSIFLSREKFSFSAKIKSDCNSLWPIVKSLLQAKIDIHFMRDPTRGGVSAALHEIADQSGYSMEIGQSNLPVSGACRDLCEILGLDILDLANEGKMLVIVAGSQADRTLSVLRRHPLGRHAAVIGEVSAEKKGRVYLKTLLGVPKVLSWPMTEPIPRIC